MREIKFRQYVWDNDDKSGPGRMVDWNEMLAEEGESLSCCFRFEFSNASPLMQFTGLKDKNGREIYEGDVVRSVEGSDRLERIAPVICESPTRWTWDCFGNIDIALSFGDIEVIGNIHENPELLKESANQR